MKQFLIACLFASAGFAQCSGTQHFQSAFITADVAFALTPQIPVAGAGPAICRAGVSILSTDENAMAFTVTIALKLTGGETFGPSPILVKASGMSGKPVYIVVPLPAGAASSTIIRFDVTRLHQEPNDVLVY